MAEENDLCERMKDSDSQGFMQKAGKLMGTAYGKVLESALAVGLFGATYFVDYNANKNGKPKVELVGSAYADGMDYQAMADEMVNLDDKTRISRFGKFAEDPDNNCGEFFNTIASAYWHSGQKEQAIKFARKATDLEPNNKTYWHNLGVYYKRAGDIPNAVEAIKKYTTFLSDDSISKKKIQEWIDKNS